MTNFERLHIKKLEHVRIPFAPRPPTWSCYQCDRGFHLHLHLGLVHIFGFRVWSRVYKLSGLSALGLFYVRYMGLRPKRDTRVYGVTASPLQSIAVTADQEKREET
jgi:hypothetical protein